MFEETFQKMAADLAEKISEEAARAVRREMGRIERENLIFVFNEKEAAEKLGVSQCTLKRLRAGGRDRSYVGSALRPNSTATASRRTAGPVIPLSISKHISWKGRSFLSARGRACWSLEKGRPEKKATIFHKRWKMVDLK